MKILRDDGLRMLRRRKDRVRNRALGGGFVVLLGLSLGLFVSSVFYPSNMREVRTGIESWAAPGLTGAVMMMAPVRRVAAKIGELTSFDDELQRLRQENQELRGWQWRASELERKLKDLRSLAKVVRKPGVGFVTAQILSVSPGPMTHSILINVGSKHGLHLGDAVINGDGLVGLVAHVSSVSARVTLLDDPKTRVDVSVGRAGVMAQIFGDRAGLARLKVMNSEEFVRAGDKVVTSGRLGGVPRGLKVGMIVQEGGGMKVAPYAALGRLEYVSVLLGSNERHSRVVTDRARSDGMGSGELRSFERAMASPAGAVGEVRESRVEPGRY